MYVISEDTDGNLVESNSALKNNLKTWINRYRMINDTVDILDVFILNIGINFVIKPTTSINKFTLLDDCLTQLKEKFETSFYNAKKFIENKRGRGLESLCGKGRCGPSFA